jgi:DNA-binding transcriptional regulator YdaS (Cro superfamily)
MTAEEFSAFIAARGWTQAHAAGVLGVRQSRVSEWSTGARKVPPYIAAHVRTIQGTASVAQVRATCPHARIEERWYDFIPGRRDESYWWCFDCESKVGQARGGGVSK